MGKVVVIGGPTASGKSALAYKLAQQKNGIVLNGDSLQVYGGLEILTDQPPRRIQGQIPHRLYGFLDPTQNFSAGWWLSYVLKEIEKSLQRGMLPIIVGGTGLYLTTLLKGMTPIPPITASIRQELEARNCTQEELYHELQTVDGALSVRIHPHDHQRTLRGLEVFYGTGKPLSEWQAEKPPSLPYDFETILLMPSKEDLQKKIRERIETMLTNGVLKEIVSILSLPLCSTVMKAIGLREFQAFIKGRCSLEYAKELTFIHTCQYAKRQRTWFRYQFKNIRSC